MVLSKEVIQLCSEGNKFYVKSQQEGTAPVLKYPLLKDAIKHYQSALYKIPKTDTNSLASMCKNITKSNYNALLLISDDETEADVSNQEEEKRKYHLRESFHFYSQAAQYGRFCKDMEWQGEIDSGLNVLIEITNERYEFLEPKEKISLFEGIKAVITENDVIYPDISLILAEIWLNEACVALNNRDFKSSLYVLKEMYQFVEEIKRFGKYRHELIEAVERFENDMIIQTRRTESMQSIHTGK